MAEETTNTQRIVNTEVLDEKTVEVFKIIYDPGIPVNIYRLGLVYDVFVNEDCDVKIFMTPTSPNCPVAGVLPIETKEKVQSIDDIHETIVESTFNPPRHQDVMNEVAKLEFGFL